MGLETQRPAAMFDEPAQRKGRSEQMHELGDFTTGRRVVVITAIAIGIASSRPTSPRPLLH